MSAEGWTVEDHLAAGTPASVALWRDLEQAIQSFGPVSLSVSKSTVTFKEELDAAFTGWLHEAYAVGCGAHLTRGEA